LFFSGIDTGEIQDRLASIPWTSDIGAFIDVWKTDPGGWLSKTLDAPYWLDIMSRMYYDEPDWKFFKNMSIENTSIFVGPDEPETLGKTAVLGWGYWQDLFANIFEDVNT
jgi:hypothetical protein